jgi:molybdenum cofactor cytidylyltransferase
VVSAARVAAIVPAAGESRRMGRDKLLLPWGETVVLGSVLDALAAAGAEPVVVVASPHNRRLRAWLEERGAASTENPRPERGMLSSVLAGLVALGGADRLAATATGLLVCPGDHAGLEPDTVRSLCAALEAGAPLAAPVYRGRRGHPLAIATRLTPEIPALDPEVGLRQLVTRHTDDLVEITVDDPAVIRDLDTLDEYRAALETR